MPRKLTLQFAGPTLLNYRAQYKARYNEEFTIQDSILLDIINDEPTWDTSTEQDIQVCISMREYHLNTIKHGE